MVTGKEDVYNRLIYRQEMSVDMPVNINIDFPRVSCNQLSVDLLDISGTQRFNLTAEIVKTPFSQAGAFPKDRNGAFNSKQDKGLPHQLLKDPFSPLLDQKGCRVEGTLLTRKVSGLLVFAPKRKNERYLVYDLFKFDVTHKINYLNFGNKSVERFSRKGVVQPLDGKEYTSKQFSKIKYFLKVVPTTYSFIKAKKKATTFEYSAQWNYQNINIGLNGAIPGVFIQFDPYPIQIDNVFQRPPFVHFIVKLCGMVGGTFVVMSFLDGLVSYYAL
ncbi:ERGIC and golgi family 3 [Strigomonas culicis]|uniref:ERGIC and golgi family 3 n=2 Tax=Strigomonas culicis TaxID=28005 RepID=S9TVT2_9TRYP|nr:ERGIC and golgi family 3 [Strigomonas culicis]|eukprot:EPY20684.1 ERGIC and golgi family 3 [Strigomonas culicis]